MGKTCFSKVKEFGKLNLVIANDRTTQERENRRQLLKARNAQAVDSRMNTTGNMDTVPLPDNSDHNIETPQRIAQKRKKIFLNRMI